jgi:hypothetical protein
MGGEVINEAFYRRVQSLYRNKAKEQDREYSVFYQTRVANGQQNDARGNQQQNMPESCFLPKPAYTADGITGGCKHMGNPCDPLRLWTRGCAGRFQLTATF